MKGSRSLYRFPFQLKNRSWVGSPDPEQWKVQGFWWGRWLGWARLGTTAAPSVPRADELQPLPARLHSQRRQDRIAVDHCEGRLLQFDNFSLVSVKNGTCIQSLRALSDSPLSYGVTHSLKHSDRFCDPVAFLDREEPSWRNPLVQQSFC